MSTQLKVSILIPAFNEEKYIAKTLAAVLNQDYPNYEVIIVDNASTDATQKVLRYFLQSYPTKIEVKVLYEANKGTQYARECGRKAASGAIIAQLDADCLPHKSWVSSGVKQLLKTKAIAITGPYDYYDSPWPVRLLTALSQALVLKPLNTIVQLANRGGIILGGNAFIKASVLKECGGYNTELCFYGDDVDIAARVSRYGHIVFATRLVLRTSSRRYHAAGFLNVQRKYNKFFFHSVVNGHINKQESIERIHPR